MELRSSNFIGQVKISFIFKLFSVLISFVLIRFLLKYLDIRDYGLWSVVISFLNWMIFFDLGIANGVKNKLAESLSEKRIDDAKKYIATGYISLFIFSFVVYLAAFFLSYFINWQNVFNVNYHSDEYLRTLVLIILFFILFNFVISLINAVFNAIQKTSFVVLNQFLTQILSLIVLVILIKYTKPNLHLLGLGYGASMFLSNLGLSVWFYSRNKDLRPRLKFYDRKKLKPIMSLGLQFFVLQITMLTILLSDRFILVQLTDVSEVTRYDIIFKYFNILIILHTIINAPLWSIYTEAYNKKDYLWIEKTMKNLSKLLVVYVMILFLMVIFGELVIQLWLNNDQLGFSITNYICMGVLMLFNITHSILSYFSNGIGKTKVQLYTSIIGATINIPLSIYFVKYLDLGLNGVILATTLSLSLFCFIGPFQVRKEIRLLKEQV